MSEAHDNSARAQQVDEILAEIMLAREAGNDLTPSEWIARYPEFASELKTHFANESALRPLVGGGDPTRTARDEGRDASDRVARPRDPITRGSTIDNSYRVIDVKHGGMGCLFIADVLPGKMLSSLSKVAIKTIGAPDGSVDVSLARRFRREAEISVDLPDHDHLIRVYFVIDLGAQPYIVMECADGGDLGTWIHDGRLTVPLAVNLAIQFCDGMQGLHAADVIHRDIKPANVLLVRPYLLKVTDYGLAKALVDPECGGQPRSFAADPSDLSAAAVGGSRPYMAPEQFVSLAAADKRSDIYSFGVMLFEMLTRTQLFPSIDEHGTKRSAQSHLELRRNCIPDARQLNFQVPQALSGLIQRCVRFDAAQRYSSFKEIRAELLLVSREFAGFPPLPRVQLPEVEQRMRESLRAARRSYSLLSLGEYERAAACAQDGINAEPQNAGHWINRGVALAQSGDQAGEATRCLKRATELAPEDPKAWANLAWALLESGDVTSALTAARKATTVDGESSDAWFALGACEHKAEARNEAVQSLARAAQLDPNNWKVYLWLATCLRELGQHRRALEYLSWGTRINPNSPDLLMETASNRFLVRQDAAAKEAVDQAIQLDPHSAAAFGLRAMITWDGTHDSAAAPRDIQRVLELEPGNEAARNLLSEIQSGATKTEHLSSRERRVTDAAFFVTDIGAAALARQCGSTVQRVPPRSLVAQADAGMELDGALLSYMSGRNLSFENVPEMVGQEWKSFLDRRFSGQTWWRWFGKTPTAVYSVVVVIGD